LSREDIVHNSNFEVQRGIISD